MRFPKKLRIIIGIIDCTQLRKISNNYVTYEDKLYFE